MSLIEHIQPIREVNSDYTRGSIPKARQNHFAASAGNDQLKIMVSRLTVMYAQKEVNTVVHGLRSNAIYNN